MKQKHILLLAAIFICAACSSKNIYTRESKKQIISDEFMDTLLIYEEESQFKTYETLVFNPKSTKEQIKEITAQGDLSYSHYEPVSDLFYIFGAGGLYSINLLNYNIEHLSDENVNHIQVVDEQVYAYENGRANDDSDKGYSTYITNLNNNDTLKLNHTVQDFEVFNNYIYVTDDTANDFIAVHVYQNNEIIDTMRFDEMGNFIVFDDILYYITKTNAYNLVENTIIDYEDKVGSLERTYQSFFEFDGNLYYVEQNDLGTAAATIYKINTGDSIWNFDSIYKLNAKTFNFTYTNDGIVTFLSDEIIQFDLNTLEETTKSFNTVEIPSNNLRYFVLLKNE